MKKNKKKPKKKVLIICIATFLIILLISVAFYFLKKQEESLKKDIKKHYNKYVITTKKTSLYDKSNKKVGTINKDFELELAKNTNSKYYKIKDTPYYIYYEDTKILKTISKSEKTDEYIVFNKNIKTDKKVALYSDNKKIVELDEGINTPILYISDNNYNIYYLNKIFQVKKSKNIKEIKKNNTQEIETNHISIVHYENINENCNDYNCINLASAKEQLTKLKENGYYSITLAEYKAFLEGKIRLKEKAILFTTTTQNDYINNLNNELDINIELINDSTGLKFNSTNKPSTKDSNLEAIDRYQIKSYSSLENILKMANGEEVIEKEPVKITSTGGQGIPVLNYHFFYDPNLGETCDEGICLTVQKFREHLDYLKNNGFRTLTMNEFTKWMYGEIDLPEKSVLITIDDGAMGTGKHNGNKLIPLLEEYKMHATLFLITGWWDISNYISPYLDIQSHTNDMHQYGTCGKGQINCYSYDEVMADLQQSINVIGNKDSFCFPFYSYSERSLQAIKDMGFRIAFVGGNRKATRNNNKYLIPRYPIQSSITLDRFKNIVN